MRSVNCCLMAVLCLAMSLDLFAAETKPLLYVSTKGRDTWSGSLSSPNAEKTDGPLATLVGARDTLRRMRDKKTLPEEGTITVEIQQGRYEQITPVLFATSGASPSPTTPQFRLISST